MRDFTITSNDLLRIMANTKHGPGGRGGPGECADQCVKCWAERTLKPALPTAEQYDRAIEYFTAPEHAESRARVAEHLKAQLGKPDPVPREEKTTISLFARDVGAYAARGAIHSLAYYDGAILDAQACGLSNDRGSVVEISADTRAAETDGSMVYLRLSREDLAALLRMLDEPTSTDSGSRYCGQHPYARDRADCEWCFPAEAVAPVHAAERQQASEQ
jgi:hypothetical protein